MFSSYCIYLGIFFLGTICVRQYSNSNKKIQKIIWLILAILLPSIIAGIRYDVGIDWRAYKSIFEYTSLYGYSYLEIGYISILRIVKYLLGGDYYFFNFTISIIMISFILLTLLHIQKVMQYKISIELGYYISLVVHYCVSFNATRQCMASAIILYALTFLCEKKYWKYFLLVLIASTFHLSAIFCLGYILFVFEISNKKKRKLYNAFIVLGIIFVSIFIQPLLEIVSNLGIIAEYAHYFENVNSNYSFGFFLYVIPPLILIQLYSKQLLKNNNYYDIFFKLFILQIPFQIAGGFVTYLDRMTLYCNISQIVIFPLIISVLTKQKVKKQCTLLVYIWYTIYFVVMWGIRGGNGIFPYKTIFI